MAREPSSLQSLKAFAKRKGEAEHAESIVAELAGGNDRATMILVGARVENALTYALSSLIRADLADSEMKALFEQNGVLSAFSAKIRLGHALSLCTGPMRDSLDVIREARNACAHAQLPISFATPELQTYLARLWPTKTLTDPVEIRKQVIIRMLLLEEHLVATAAAARKPNYFWTKLDKAE